METDDRDRNRTVVVSGVPGDVLPDSRMVDKLTIHFQSRRRSRGGDVEVVRYPTNLDGVAFVTFDRARDAERVVRKEQQMMEDDEFPKAYLLTVFPFTRDVFFYVRSATVNLSVFGRDQASLIKSLQSAHRSLRFGPLLQQGKATIEGPFAAVQALREDLIRRADLLKSTVPTQTAAKLKETPLNPRVISHPEFVSPISRSSSKAKLELASSNSLSSPPQTTGEAAKVQTLLSDAKTQNGSWGRKVSGSFCNPDSDEEEQSTRPRLQMSSERRTERAKANSGHVFTEEINAGIRSSLSGQNSLSPEKISAKQPGEDDILQKRTRAERVSPTRIRGGNHLGSRADYLKESNQSSSAVTDKHLQTRLADVSQSSKSSTKDTTQEAAACAEQPEVKCLWVDSYTYRYIEKFNKEELDRCLKGLNPAVECVKGSDLMEITLTERRTSKTSSRLKDVLKDLSALVDLRQSMLRFYEINYDKKALPDKQKLIQICDDVYYLFDDVLYTFEGSCIKMIGPKASSFLFYRRVEDRIAELKDKSLFI